MKNHSKKTNINRNSNSTRWNTPKSPKSQSAVNQFLQDNAKRKPTVEENPVGVPMTLKIFDNPNLDMLLLIDEAQYGRRFKVENEKIYTIRLGIHSNPNSPAAIPAESVGILSIPTASAKEISIIALFAFKEISPAVFGDSVILCSDKGMHLEYVYNSTRLESNNGLGGLTLDNPNLTMEHNMTSISYNNLGDRLPQPNITFSYDFITVQVKVKFDE